MARKKRYCTICELFFANITTHKRTHLSPSEKLYSCSLCNKSYNRNFDFLRHQNEHFQKPKLESLDQKMSEHDTLTAFHNKVNILRCLYNTKLIILDLSLYKQKQSPPNNMMVDCHTNCIFSRKDFLDSI